MNEGCEVEKNIHWSRASLRGEGTLASILRKYPLDVDTRMYLGIGRLCVERALLQVDICSTSQVTNLMYS